MFKSCKWFMMFVISLALIFNGCKKEASEFDKQFDSDSKKIKSKIDQADNSIRNIEITIATMKSDFLMNADKVSAELSNIKKTQTELRDTLNNLINVKVKTSEIEGGKTPFFWIIIYLIIFIIIIWAFFKFFKGKSEEEEEANEFSSFYEGPAATKEEKSGEAEKKE